MTLIRARAANDHDHYLSGNSNLLTIRSNSPLKTCPVFDNVLLQSPWILGQYITRNGNVFSTTGGSTNTPTLSLEHRALSMWAAIADFSIILKKSNNGLASTSGLLGLDFSITNIEPFNNLMYAGLLTTDAASQPLGFYHSGRDGTAVHNPAPVKLDYDVLMKISRSGSVTKLSVSTDCGITFVDKYTFLDTNVIPVFANINISDNNGSYTLVQSSGFAPYTPPPPTN